MKAPEHLSVAYYHCVSRVVNRDFLLGEEEKEQFVGLMRTYERFCGLRVVAYCVMSNHFHVLVEVPRRPAEGDLPDDGALVELVEETMGGKAARDLAWEIGQLEKIGASGEHAELRERWLGRMWEISEFMKGLKQRFTQWFNRRHGRRGTLWEARFRSVLIEGHSEAMRAMAAYIDLNPVRAGICEDPKEYRWCGYAEAVAGDGLARDAVEWLVSMAGDGRPLPEGRRSADQVEALRRWRCWLFGIPESEGNQAAELARGDAAGVRKGIPRDQALKALAAGGRLSAADFLRCRVRVFTDGVALGGKNFIEDVFVRRRQHFGGKRKSGSRLLRGLEIPAPERRLYGMRDLRKDVFG